MGTTGFGFVETSLELNRNGFVSLLLSPLSYLLPSQTKPQKTLRTGGEKACCFDIQVRDHD